MPAWKCSFLAAVGERVDLAVAVHLPSGPASTKRVERPVTADRGTSGQEPPTHRPCSFACSPQERELRPTTGSPDRALSHREPGRERLGEQRRSGARGRPRCRIIGARRAKFASLSLPDDVVLDGGDLHRAQPLQARRPPRRSPRGACRTRTAPCAGLRACRRRTPRWGWRRRRTAAAARGRTPCRRRRPASGGCRR